MQWLIDIAIAAMKAWIYENGIYITAEPGDFGSWNETHLTTDGTRHTLDISAKLPEHTRAVNMSVIVQTANVNAVARFFHPDAAAPGGRCIIRTQVANIHYRAIQAIAVSDDGKVDYTFSNVVWDEIGVLIRGVWL